MKIFLRAVGQVLSSVGLTKRNESSLEKAQIPSAKQNYIPQVSVNGAVAKARLQISLNDFANNLFGFTNENGAQATESELKKAAELALKFKEQGKKKAYSDANLLTRGLHLVMGSSEADYDENIVLNNGLKIALGVNNEATPRQVLDKLKKYIALENRISSVKSWADELGLQGQPISLVNDAKEQLINFLGRSFRANELRAEELGDLSKLLRERVLFIRANTPSVIAAYKVQNPNYPITRQYPEYANQGQFQLSA